MSGIITITAPAKIFTPKYLVLQDILDEHERAHWVPEEADMGSDIEQWKNGTIKDSEKAYIKNVLRLFTQSDTDICGLYVGNLIPIFKNPDARMMLLSFANREVTHIKGYKRLNDTLGYDSEEFMGEFLNYSEMKDKHDFILSTGDLTDPVYLAEYLAKQVLMEGVNLFASFAMLLSWSKQGKLPGMVSINQWSIVEESLHVRGLCELFKIYLQENPKIVSNNFKANIYETARQIVKMEDDFIKLCYRVGTNDNVSEDSLMSYIRYVCDYRMMQLGLKAQFNVKTNPIPWMDMISSNTFANFFETTSVQYSKASMTGNWVY